MSRRKQSNPKPLLKNESENPMTILQQDPESNSTEIDDEQSTVASDDNTLARSQSISESDKKDTPANDASPLSLETSSHSSTPATSTTPIASPTLPIDIKIETKTTDSNELNSTNIELPKLRLNITLASDPALQPEAKHIQSIRANTVENYENESNCDEEMQEDSVSSPILVHDDNGPPPEKIRKQNDSTFRSSGNKFVVNLQSNVNPTDIIPRVPAFICAPCGIKFSSISTLEAHQTFYCTHSKKDTEDSNNPLKVILVDDGSSTESATKTVRTTKQYGCNQCSYSADKKVSLNRHMRMHQTSPTSSSVTSNGDDCSSQIQPSLQQPTPQQPIQLHQVDRYCTDCDIRFSNTKTFRAHKEFYCGSRHRDGSGPPTSSTKTVAQKPVQPKTTDENNKFPETIGPTQPFLALPTTPIIIIPYSLIRGANVLPGPLSVSSGVANPDLNCYVLQNGSLQPIAQAISIANVGERAKSTRPQTPIAKTSTQPSDSEISPNHLETTSKNSKRSTNNREGNTTPLDLSVRRLSVDRSYRERSASISSSISGDLQRINMDALNDGKENLLLNSSNSASPEQIVCAPSLPGSPPPLTPSPKRSSASPRGILTLSPSALVSNLHMQPNTQTASTILRPLLVNELTARLTETNSVAAVLNSSAQHLLDGQNFELALNIATNVNNVPLPIAKTTSPNATGVTKKPIIGASTAMPLVQPQIFVKQGVSKCKECNIVFCKYENYLAHKKHYCSSRNIDENADGKVKPSPPTSPLAAVNSTGNSSGTIHGHGAYQQLICAACGIKFTSLDNLKAHQTYYCTKRIEAPTVVKDKCIKCKNFHDASQPCVTNQTLYKCPVCDVVSANSTESRKHLETHAGVKAFRCTICGYKGNTLRGMRTHIRMHFDKKTNDFNEENYISCTLDDENVEAPAPILPSPTLANQASSPENAQAATAAAILQTLHCDKCSYTSTFKGNLIRHIKIAHSTDESIPSSIIIGEGDDSLVCDTENDTQNSARVIVKSEPTETRSSDRSPNTIPESNDIVMNTIKIENVEISDNDEDEKKSVDSDSARTYQRSPNLTRALLTGVTAANSISLNASTSGDDSQYCHICDIKFKYMNSYLAHKKSYCRNVKNDLDIVPVTSNPPRSSPNQTSVVT